MPTDLTRISTSVTGIEDAGDSAVSLLGQLSQLLRDNATDPAAINALADRLDAQKQELADAIVANTPAA